MSVTAPETTRCPPQSHRAFTTGTGMCRSVCLHLHLCSGKCSESGSCHMAIKMFHFPRQMSDTNQAAAKDRTLPVMSYEVSWRCMLELWSSELSPHHKQLELCALNMRADKLPHWFHSQIEKCLFDRFPQISQELSCLTCPALGTTVMKIKKTFCMDQ